MKQRTRQEVGGQAPGYTTRALIAPLHWFDFVSPSIPGTGQVTGIHIMGAGYDYIKVYVLPKSLQASSNIVGESGGITAIYNPQFFIPGEGPELLAMVEELQKGELLLLVEDIDSDNLQQFGNEKLGLYVVSASFTGGNAYDGRKGYELQCSTPFKYTYVQNPTFKDLFLARAYAKGYTVDEIDTTIYENAPAIVKNKSSFLLPALAYTTGIMYGVNDLWPVPIPFARASNATRINSQGVAEIVAANVPRLNYDLFTQAPTGYLLEPASQNLVTRSEPSAGQDWGNFTFNGTTLYEAGMFGDVKQYFFRENGLPGEHSILSGLLAAPAAQTLSIHIKAHGRTKVKFSNTLVVDLTDGSSTAAGAVDSEVLPLPDGWYSIKTYAAGPHTWKIYLLNGSDSNNYVGDGNSGVDVRMLQIEGHHQPTSYMPSYGAGATRAADILDYTGIQLNEWLPAGEGCAYHELRLIEDTFQTATVGVAITAASIIGAYSDIDGSISNYGNLQAVTSLSGRFLKSALKYSSGVLKEYIDGQQVTDIVYGTPTTLDRFIVSASITPLHLGMVALFYELLLNAEMITITETQYQDFNPVFDPIFIQ